MKILFLDVRPARTGPVARRERLVAPRSRSVGLRLRLLTWCPYGASPAQVSQQARKAQVPDEKSEPSCPTGRAGGPPRAHTPARR